MMNMYYLCIREAQEMILRRPLFPVAPILNCFLLPTYHFVSCPFKIFLDSDLQDFFFPHVGTLSVFRLDSKHSLLGLATCFFLLAQFGLSLRPWCCWPSWITEKRCWNMQQGTLPCEVLFHFVEFCRTLRTWGERSKMQNKGLAKYDRLMK